MGYKTDASFHFPSLWSNSGTENLEKSIHPFIMLDTSSDFFDWLKAAPSENSSLHCQMFRKQKLSGKFSQWSLVHKKIKDIVNNPEWTHNSVILENNLSRPY